MDRAKEIFMKYGGCFFHIHRDMMLDEYKSYGVSKETENEWIIECQENCIAQIKDGYDVTFNMNKICTIMREKKNAEYLSELLEALEISVNKIDTFKRLVLTEQVVELVKYLDSNNIADSTECKEFIKRGLQEITSEPMTISDETMRKKKTLCKDKHMEDYIAQRAEDNLSEFNW